MIRVVEPSIKLENFFPTSKLTILSSAPKINSEGQLIDFCKETLAGFKVPKKVIFCELPKTSTGKIQKFELRKQF